MGTRPVALGLAVVGVAIAAAPAGAQEPVTVEASDFKFTPASVTVTIGQAVRFTNAGGSHNVHFSGEASLFSPAPPDGPAWLAGPSKTFPTAGEYRFVCDPHQDLGMRGTVVVQAPAPAPAPGPGAPGAPAPAAPAPAAVRRLELARERVCTRPGRTCRRPGVVLRVDLTARGELTGRLERRPLGRRAAYRPFGRVALGTVPAGLRSVRFTRTASGRRLKPGRYRLEVALDGRAARTLRFVVRPA
jgi:plastocyanin